MNQMFRPAQQQERRPLEALAGTVERVTFHNVESGFAVLKVQARGKRDLVTVVGHAPMIGAGEWVTASGAWVSDRTHGLQFRADVLKTTPPTGIEGEVSRLWADAGHRASDGQADRRGVRRGYL